MTEITSADCRKSCLAISKAILRVRAAHGTQKVSVPWRFMTWITYYGWEISLDPTAYYGRNTVYGTGKYGLSGGLTFNSLAIHWLLLAIGGTFAAQASDSALYFNSQSIVFECLIITRPISVPQVLKRSCLSIGSGLADRCFVLENPCLHFSMFNPAISTPFWDGSINGVPSTGGGPGRSNAYSSAKA
ncbi:hypothetical protein K438DRAFT_1781429 [Mycena galopus ATCC 62051]|nr:hypothetical protein K438DRAFT_1781429 [Mycena galopus ATCC 62051]